MLPDLHTYFSRGRLGGLVFLSLSEFSTVYGDPHSPRLGIVNKAEIDGFWNSLAFSMIQRMLAISVIQHISDFSAFSINQLEHQEVHGSHTVEAWLEEF